MNVYRGWMTNLIFIFAIFIAGCSGGGGDGGIDGSGLNVEGTAAVGEPLANAEIIVKGANGSKKRGTTDANGKFNINVDGLTAPYVLKVRDDLKNRTYYSLAKAKGRHNIHPVSDVVARNWFKSKNKDIDDEFGDDSNETPIDYSVSSNIDGEIDDLIQALTRLLLAAYGDFGVNALFNFQYDSFDANNINAFDGLLDNLDINIKQDMVTIVLADPNNEGVEDPRWLAIIILNFNLATPLSDEDAIPPATPTGLVAYRVSDTRSIVVWNPSSDNVGVAGYRVYRDGGADPVITTAFPVFSDSGLDPALGYCYTVEAFDGAGLTSPLSAEFCIDEVPVPAEAPAAMTNLVAAAESNTEISLTWTPSISSDVIGYDIWRGSPGQVTDDPDNKIATMVASSFNDFNLTPETEYCYIVRAFGPAGLRSVDSDEVCATTPSGVGGEPDTTPPTTSASVPGGTYNIAQTVTLTCDDGVDGSGCLNTYYSMDGSDPTVPYTSPINISSNTTLRFYSVDVAGNEEGFNQEIYVITGGDPVDTVAPVTTPTPAGGSYPLPGVSVTLNCTDGTGSGCATTYCTTDGSDPTTGSPVITGNIDISSTTTLKCFSVDNNGNSETFFTEEYTIVDETAPTSTTAANFINGGDSSTTDSSLLSLSLSATDNVGVSAYCAMDNNTGVEPTPAGGCWVPVTPVASYGDTVAYNTTATYQDGDNIHVFVWFRDEVNNVSLASVSHDTILFATTPGGAPANTTGANFINRGALSTGNPQVRLSISATDTDGDLSGYLVRHSSSPTPPAIPAQSDPAWVSVLQTTDFSADVIYTFPGSYSNGDTVYAHVWFRDSVGNISLSTVDDIVMARALYFSDNFEDGLDNWTVSGVDWARIESDSVSGSHAITDSPLGDYQPSSDTIITLTNEIDLSASLSPVLSFWMKLEEQDASDYARVEVSTTSGSSWSILNTFGNNYGVSWEHIVLSLSAYQGQSILIRFRMIADADTTIADGLMVDDVVIGERYGTSLMFPFSDDFENGLSNWLISGQEWNTATTDVVSGTTSVTDSPLGNYVPNTNATITLADSIDLTGSVEPVLSFWKKSEDLDTADYTRVYLSIDGGVNWSVLSTFSVNYGVSWEYVVINLSAYAGQQVKVRFGVDADADTNVYDGLTIDDVEIRELDPALNSYPFADDFESGLGNWVYSGGDWGAITADSVSGSTAITDSPVGDYLPNSDAYIQMANSVELPVGGFPALSFWKKVEELDAADYSRVYISTTGGASWSILQTFSNNYGVNWEHVVVDLSAYQGQRIKIRFALESDTDATIYDGILIDDVEISDRDPVVNSFPFADDFESGLGNWLFSGGDWGTTTADSVSGSTAITDSPLGDYVPNSVAQIDLAHSVDLAGTVSPVLSFWKKVEELDTADYGRVYLSINGGITWNVLQTFANDYGVNWEHIVIDLSGYQGQLVKIRFELTSDTDTSIFNGVIIDDVEIREAYTGSLGYPFSDDFESGLGNWMLSGGDWGTTTTDSVSGATSITDSPAGNYAQNSDAYITMRHSIDLTGAINPELRFAYRVFTPDPGDYAYAQISTDEGVSWTSMLTITSATTNWENATVSLGAYAGQSIKIRFLLTADTDATVNDGVYIDDVVIANAP
jgi:hypothetical protein